MKKHREKEYNELCQSLRNNHIQLMDYLDKMVDIKFKIDSTKRKLNQIEIERDLRS